MARFDPVREFVRDALLAGRSRQEIADSLAAAGWSEREVRQGLDDFAPGSSNPPTPRPRAYVTARETFLYSVLFVALAFTAVQLVQLVNAILDAWMPDPGDPAYLRTYAATWVRWASAVLVVSAPVFVWMTAWTDRRIAADPSLRRSPVRKWVLYIALFCSGLTLLGDASYTIYSFLSGELTIRFLLKAATVAIVSGVVLAFYLHGVEAFDAK